MSELASSSEIKMGIIQLLTKIDDVNKLHLIYKQAVQLNENTETKSSSIAIEGAITEIEEGVTLEQILKEQNYQPFSYQEFRALADQIEWEHSLEELLEALD
ncbi:MAG: hypothetical protein AAF798_05500 [Bacteroidota bacterium]